MLKLLGFLYHTCIGKLHTGLMNTPAHVSGQSGQSGLPAAPHAELAQSRGQEMWKHQQLMTEQTALGTKLRPLPATLTHAVRKFVIKLYRRILVPRLLSFFEFT